MDVIYACCCGRDVHKKTVAACLVTSTEGPEPLKEMRTFRTMTAELLALADWLQKAGCPHMVMESTGVYWRPVYNLLEGQYELLVVNAQHIKAVPGRKSDVKDAAWIAELLRHGLLRGSFIPSSRNGSYAGSRGIGARWSKTMRERSIACTGHSWASKVTTSTAVSAAVRSR